LCYRAAAARRGKRRGDGETNFTEADRSVCGLEGGARVHVADVTSEADVLAVIQRIIETKVDFRGGKIDAKSDLIRDLELDSVSRTVVLVAIEDHYHLTLDGALLAEVQNVGDLVAIVVRLVGSK
jgi:acyl carrier protein